MDMYTIQLCRLSGRLREQARSHSLRVGCQVDLIGWQAVIAGKPAPTLGSRGVRPPPLISPPRLYLAGLRRITTPSLWKVSWKVVIRRKKPGVQPLPQGLHTFQITSYRLDHFYVVIGDQSVPCL